MIKINALTGIAISLTLLFAACSSSDDNTPDNTPNETSQFNPDLVGPSTDGAPGGDTSLIAGLWDGTVMSEEVADVIYWNISSDGVITQYDYQQDGVLGATGENCYVVLDPITVTPEDDDVYSIGNVAVSASVADNILNLAFLEADQNDFDENGDTTETPVFAWPMLTTAVLSDLSDCDDANPVEDQSAAIDDQPETLGAPVAPDSLTPVALSDGLERRELTSQECMIEGGEVIGDIGNGAIHKPEFRCESGLAPLGRIRFVDGEPIASEGAVCCV